MNFFKKFLNILSHLLLFLFLIGLAFIVSYFLYVWSGFPVAGDAPQHLFRFRFINEFFPHYNWVHLWAGGMPQFIWYPVAPYLVLSAILRISGQTPEFVLTFTSVLAIGLTAIGIYLLVREITQSRVGGILASIFYLLMPSSWTLIHSSVYVRSIAVPLVVFALWLFVKYWRENLEGRFNKGAWIATAGLLGIAVLFHFAMGIFTYIFIFILAIVSGGKKIGATLLKLIKLFSVSIVLSISFWLPSLIFKMPGFKMAADAASQNQPTIPWKDLLFFQNPLYTAQYSPYFYFLPFFVLGALALFILLSLIFKRDIFAFKTFQSKMFWAFLVLFLLALIYAQFPIGHFAAFYANVQPPLWVIFYYSIFLAPLLAILFIHLFSKKWKIIFLLPALGGLIFWFYTMFPVQDAYDVPYKHFQQSQEAIFFDNVSKKFIENQQQFNYRVGTGNFGILAGWFNNNNLYLPQTREYFYLAVLKPDWYFYMVQNIWNVNDNYNETNFLLDWWAVRQFFTGDETVLNPIQGKFESQPEQYLPLGNYQYDLTSKIAKRYNYNGFEFSDATPIISATPTPAVLVIGDLQTGYNFVFRSLAYANLDSTKIIPVIGGEYIDSYTVQQLEQFPTIFLYNYSYKNKSKVEKLLAQYLDSGGRVIIEASKDSNRELYNILPVESTKKIDISSQWDMELTSAGRQILGKINLDDFSPAVYDNGPWGASVAVKVKEDTQILLTSHNQPIMVSQMVGQNGQIIWSGINLPFHIVSNQNDQESELMGKLVSARLDYQKEEAVLDENLLFKTTDYQVDFINPQKRVVKIFSSEMNNILFKEFYFPNWRAYGIKDNQKIALKIYPAGPEFMMVNLPAGVTEVVLEYKNSRLQKISLYLSIFFWLLLLMYAFEGKRAPISGLLKKITLPRLKKVGEWWDKEEE